jgi:hypothetical protein
MALIGNRSVLHKSPGRFLSGTIASIERSNFSKGGMIANRFQSLSKVFAGMPGGHLSPSSWSLPRTAGAMSSFNEAGLSISANGLAVGGVNASASASMSLAATATGQLIAFAQGSASMMIGATGAMTGIIQGSGAASFSLTTNNPILGAIASGSGSASMSLSASANILPVDDTPPARTASASLSITGSATLRAIGHMSGSTVDNSILTSDTVASAVWSASAAQNNVAGTMGEKLNDAGSAANPWTEVIEAGYTAAQILRILASHAAGSATGLEGANPQFKGLDGTTVRIDGSYVSGTRTIDALNGN